MLLKPPPDEYEMSGWFAALSAPGANTLAPGFSCVPPTLVMYGQLQEVSLNQDDALRSSTNVLGNPGLKIVALTP